MQDSGNNIFKQEEEILKKAKSLIDSNNKDADLLFKEYAVLSKAYEDLLKNAALLTSISDRFQEKYKLANDKLKSQAEIINNINLQLDADNRALKSDLKSISKKNYFAQLSDINFFYTEFSSKEVCLNFISDLKWKKEYACKKCGNTKCCDGNSYMAKRCTKCRYDESVTAFTLLHKCKFPIEKALYMSLLIYYRKGKISSYELSSILDLRQKTCWSFKQKTMDAMKNINLTEEHSLENWHAILLSY